MTYQIILILNYNILIFFKNRIDYFLLHKSILLMISNKLNFEYFRYINIFRIFNIKYLKNLIYIKNI